MTDRDFVFWATEELRRLSEPVRVALHSPQLFVAFLERYGWSPPPGSFQIDDVRNSFDVIEDISTSTQLVGRLLSPASDETSLETYLELAETVRSIAGHVRGLGGRPRPAGLSEELWTSFGEDLLHGLVADYLESYRPLLLAPLILAGVVEEQQVDPGGAPDRIPYVRRRIRWDRLGQALTDPGQLTREFYGWDDPGGPLRFELLVNRLHRALGLLGLPTVLAEPSAALVGLYYDPANPAIPQLQQLEILLMGGEDEHGDLFQYTLGVLPIPPVGHPAQAPDGLVLAPSFVLDSQPSALLWPFSLEFSGIFQTEGSARLELEPGRAGVATGGPGTTAVDAGFAIVFDSPNALRLLGTAYSHRLQLHGWRLGVQVSGPVDDLEISLELDLTGMELVIVFAEGDSLVRELFGGGTRMGFDVGVVWSSKSGLHLRGRVALELVVPLHVTIGPVRLDVLTLGLRSDTGRTALTAALTGSAQLGPFGVAVSNLGFRFVLTPVPADRPAGALGDLDLDLEFKPPDGIGLSVEAGVVTGGGFIRFDESTGRYSGQLQLNLGNIGVDAVGLLDTRLPGGAQGYSLLVLLRASFPPIQIGFGFALSSVGGLLALNRRVDVDALRSRMASGTAGRILAPEDPVRNAPVLLSDLAAVFPPAEGVVVVGPTLQLFWVDLVRFDIGLFFELPGPTKIVVLGSARAIIENPSGGRPYLQLRLDILGVADLAKQTLEFDAVLIDSNLLEILELTGGAAFRLSTGAEPYLVLTVGGFHPAYSPAPLVFPASLTRVAMTRGTPTDDLYFRFEGYFAITTNSLQFGASVEVIANAGSFNIRGFLGFDALIRFQPFHFTFTISASVKVRWKGRTLAGLELRGELSGPGPVVFRGKVCIELLFFDICFEETFTLGSLLPPVVTAIASAVAELLAELVNPANLRAAGAADPFVAVAPAEAGTSLPVVSPVGQLAWSQERAPLDLLLQRFEGAPLTTPETVSATGPQVTGPDEDWFAPGGFAELSDADALNRRAFERLHGGVRLGVAGTDDGPSAAIDVQVKQIRIPAPPVVLVAAVLPAWVLRAAAGRAGTIERDPVVPALGVRSEAWVLRGGDGAVVADGLSQAQAHQLATVAAAGTAVARTDTVAAFAF